MQGSCKLFSRVKVLWVRVSEQVSICKEYMCAGEEDVEQEWEDKG